MFEVMVSEQGIRSLADVEELGRRLQYAYSWTKGNAVEIGGGEGINTLHLLQVAQIKETTVIVVDPFEQIPGADESYFKPYTLERFKATINAYPDLSKNMLLIDLPSQHPDVKTDLQSWMPIGFMFIDGLQDKESVLSDLLLAQQLETEIICVDDYDRLTESSQVPLAVLEFLKVTMYKMVNIGKREIYFIRN